MARTLFFTDKFPLCFMKFGWALAACVVLGTVCQPVFAQTLSGFVAGDSITVSSMGTHGTLNSGAINNPTTSYTATATPGAAVTLNAGTFTLSLGGTLSGGAGFLADGLDVGLSPASGGGVGGGTVFVTGGVINGFDAISVGGGTVTITGGSITGGPLPGQAGLVAQLSASNPGGGGTINLYGTNFLVNGSPAPSSLMGLGTAALPTTITGTVSGTLADGEHLGTNYQLVGPGTTINFFAPAPEPSPWAVLALGGAGVLGRALMARRRLKRLT